MIALTIVLFSFFAYGGWRNISDSDLALPPPPLPASRVDNRDLAALLWRQAHREYRDCRFAGEHPESSFASLYGGFLMDAEVQRLRPLFDELMALTKRIVGPLKIRTARPRPFSRDGRVQPCISTSEVDDLSYPSGHAMFGAVSACVLSELYPGLSGSLSEYGRYLGDYRVTVGVHYPSDVAAGRSLGRQLCTRLLGDDQFRRELERVSAALSASVWSPRHSLRLSRRLFAPGAPPRAPAPAEC